MSLGPSTRPRHTFSWFLLITANVLWACSYVAAKFALRDISVNVMLALRMTISAIVLLPLLVSMRKQLNLTRRDLPQLIVLAIVGFVINKLLEYGGLSLTTASDVALLITSESIFTAALSWLVRVGMAVGVVFDMTVKPDVWIAVIAVVVGAAVGVAAGLAARREVRST